MPAAQSAVAKPAAEAKPAAAAGQQLPTVEEMNEFLAGLVRSVMMGVVAISAFTIRLHAVVNYGRVIHEFDPWFNYRATEYLVQNGWSKFFNWYDEMSWYPLGRPVGTTIYPGLQITAAALYYAINAVGIAIPLNDVCVFMPAVFAVVTCGFTYLLTVEVSGSNNGGVAASFIMAITPSHLMRSVAGGYDNESIAVCAIVATFYFWVRSLRTPSSWPFGLCTALSYIYMVGAWGGYIFVLNMVGVHALAMALLPGRFDSGMHRAYSIFFVVGTLGAIQYPVVGLAPLKSLEQLGPMGVFFFYQLLEVINQHRLAHPNLTPYQSREFALKVFAGAGAVGAFVLAAVLPTGYLGPVSSRVRGLFVPHTRTGNPLVDSVAEHQATRPEMYYAYFHWCCVLAPLGFVMSWFPPRTSAKYFLILYTAVTYYFSHKMVRLVLILAPASSIAGGIALTRIVEWSTAQFMGPSDTDRANKAADEPTSAASVPKRKLGKRGPRKPPTATSTPTPTGTHQDPLMAELMQVYRDNRLIRRIIAALCWYYVLSQGFSFMRHSVRMSASLSNPSIMLRGRTQTGETVMIDDFREAYWWLRDETPEDARVLSWWDYGYQIAGIANRTTIADGNTWNHEHIALLGKSLVSPIPKAHKIVRHLADYVLVWSTRYGGMHGDDVAKSPHMARIGGSVYKDIDARAFYMDRQGKPSEMMRESLIYNLVNFRLDPEIPNTHFWMDPTEPPEPEEYFQEVYTTMHRMVRIYKVVNVSEDSKEYCSHHRGYRAWYEGRPLLDAYPPALQKLLAEKEDFAQLEDFNRK